MCQWTTFIYQGRGSFPWWHEPAGGPRLTILSEAIFMNAVGARTGDTNFYLRSVCLLDDWFEIECVSCGGNIYQWEISSSQFSMNWICCSEKEINSSLIVLRMNQFYRLLANTRQFILMGYSEKITICKINESTFYLLSGRFGPKGSQIFIKCFLRVEYIWTKINFKKNGVVNFPGKFYVKFLDLFGYYVPTL